MTPISAGLLLFTASAAGFALANSPLAGGYQAVLDVKLGGISLHHAVNDGLMTLFFLLVGCEIKRELQTGQLKTAADRGLPGFAAMGGIFVPAMIYATVNLWPGGMVNGWAVPAATDIAFALGVLAIVSRFVPPSAAVLLTTIAVLDDMAAILIIALIYSGGLDPLGLTGMAAALALLWTLKKRRVQVLWPYLAIGLGLWAATALAGLHATIAGVLLAAMLPLGLAKRVEHRLHGVSAAVILPLFGLANAGVSLAGLSLSSLIEPITLGIILGLVVGKPIGILFGCWIAVRFGLARLPADLDRRTLIGIACLCGIGFTMSLFIGLLAFAADPALIAAMKLGVLAGSLASALLGVAVIRVWRR